MKNIPKFFAGYLQALRQLYQSIFVVYIQRDYFVNRISYEKYTAKYTTQVFQSLQKIRKALVKKDIISHLENLYEILFSLGLLKYRILDHATFEVCELELKNINLAIVAALSEVNLNGVESKALLRLRETIESFEVVFQTTLQFITADPLFFLFFIRDLKALHDELKYLSSVSYENVVE